MVALTATTLYLHPGRPQRNTMPCSYWRMTRTQTYRAFLPAAPLLDARNISFQAVSATAR